MGHEPWTCQGSHPFSQTWGGVSLVIPGLYLACDTHFRCLPESKVQAVDTGWTQDQLK